jgi:hypothetical protein
MPAGYAAVQYSGASHASRLPLMTVTAIHKAAPLAAAVA